MPKEKKRTYSKIITMDKLVNSDFILEFFNFDYDFLDHFKSVFKRRKIKTGNAWTQFTSKTLNEQDLTFSLQDFELLNDFTENALSVSKTQNVNPAGPYFSFEISDINFDDFQRSNFQYFTVQRDNFSFLSQHRQSLKQSNQEIIRLYFQKNQKVSEISRLLHCSLQKVYRTIKTFQENPESFYQQNSFQNVQPIHKQQILDVVDDSLENQIRFKSIHLLKKDVMQNLEANPLCNFDLRNFLRNNKYRFKKIKKPIKTSQDTPINVKRFLCYTLNCLRTKKPVFYFDITTVVSDSFAKKSWFKRHENFRPSEPFVYSFTHILGMISGSELISLQFVEGPLTADSIKSFFVETLSIIRQKIQIQTPIHVILDNAPVNKSRDLQNLCFTLNANLVFIVPHHPMLNPIELFWAVLKTPLRQSFFIHRHQIKDRLLQRLKEIQTRHYRSFELSLFDVWIRNRDY